MRTPIKALRSHSHRRTGTTLSEVLISMLIMSIGVVSLATLFPISVLRSVQATQLTNATNLRYNVEALVHAIPQIRTIGSPWQPKTDYALNTWIVPSVDSPLTNYTLSAVCTAAGKSGSKEPNWLQPSPISETVTAPDTPAQWTVYRLNNYIVDPLGEYIATYDDPTAMLRGAPGGSHVFGNNSSGVGATSSVRAFSGLIFQGPTPGTPSPIDDYQAAGLAALPDSWISQAESQSISYTATSCTLNDISVDLSQTVPVPAGVSDALLPARILLFDVTGKFSCSRPISSISGNTLSWNTSLPATKPDGTPFIPMRARIETAERRFTWMLCVRHASSTMDVVVFFRRKYSSKDEQIYPATFQTGPIDPNSSDPANNQWAFYSTDPGYDAAPGINGIGSNTISELGLPGSDDSPRNWVVIQYDATGDKPFYKKGGFVTDITNLQWYRITDIVEGDSPASVMTKAGIPTSATNMPTYQPDQQITGYKSALLRLERPITMNSPAPVNGAGGIPRGGAIFMRGVVEVYPVLKSN